MSYGGDRPDSREVEADEREAEVDHKIRLATEKFLHEVTSTPSEVMNGLTPRPRPGQKKAAQDAFMKMLRQIHELRRSVELAKPMQITTGGDSHE